MQYEDINIDALKATLDLLFGPDATQMVQKTYTAFAAAMEKAETGSFGEGFEAGYAQAESDQDVINMDAAGMLEELAYDAEREFYEGDSGDEQPTLSTEEIPAQTHGVTDPGHTHGTLADYDTDPYYDRT